MNDVLRKSFAPEHFGRASLLLIAAWLVFPGMASLRAADEPAKAGKKAVEAEAGDEVPYPRAKAPELDGGTGWLNTSGEITLKDLRGKIVLLDFWTYCCINCMHVLPDLKYLEQKYPKEVVVIGVHSAKFDNEKETENIRRAIMRYEIEHPVINDSKMTVWRKFGVRSWPTLAVLDPEGYYLGALSGEGNRQNLEQVIDKLIAFHKRKGTLDETPIRFDLERRKAEATPLRFPGKVLADEVGRRLFVSDSNHNRIVVAALDGKLQDVIGTGAIGKADGAYDQASFDHPQGMALVGETLYVADTENHMLRAVDLTAKQVKTIAGTGQQGHERRNGGPGLELALNSPWDLAHIDGRIYVAMAGPHQVWVYDVKKGTIQPFAGSGVEDIRNGPYEEAALAQPSGITTDGRSLYVVDSEGSAVRKIGFGSQGEVTTIVGTSDLQPAGRSLFEFGDRDGVGADARLQHPLGITYHTGTLYVADSYNHKIKQVDPAKKTAKTLAGDRQPGAGNNPARFSEPAGLSVAGNILYVADTNNHKLRTIDLKAGTVANLEIKGLSAPKPQAASEEDDSDTKPLAVKPQKIVAGDTLAVEVALQLPEGYKLNKLSPITYRLKGVGAQSLVSADQLEGRHEIEPPAASDTLKFQIPLASRTGKGELRLTVTYGYCREGTGGLCKLGTLSWSVPIELVRDAGTKVLKLSQEP